VNLLENNLENVKELDTQTELDIHKDQLTTFSMFCVLAGLVAFVLFVLLILIVDVLMAG